MRRKTGHDTCKFPLVSHIKVPVLFSLCQQKTRPEARYGLTQFNSIAVTLFFFFNEVCIFHRGGGSARFTFVLDFVELSLQLVD